MMKCLKYNRATCKAEYTTEEIPKIQSDDEIIVRISLSGICGTDLHILANAFDARDGVILGHEMIGTVHEVPENSKKFKKGDRVAVNPNYACGLCRYCKKGKYNFCETGGLLRTLGIYQDGGWAEYCKAHISLVAKLSDAITDEQAVLCEPLSCVVHALEIIKSANVIGSNILIIGAGIIGLLWINVLHVLGHRQIYLSEPNMDRQETVKKLDLGINCMTWDEILELKKNEPDWSVDLCIDCSGNTGAVQAAIPVLDYGATLLMFGVADPHKTIDVAPFEIFRKELTLKGTCIQTATSFQKSISLLESLGEKYITSERLAMKKFKLADFEEALAALRKGTYSKIVFEL